MLTSTISCWHSKKLLRIAYVRYDSEESIGLEAIEKAIACIALVTSIRFIACLLRWLREPQRRFSYVLPHPGLMQISPLPIGEHCHHR